MSQVGVGRSEQGRGTGGRVLEERRRERDGGEGKEIGERNNKKMRDTN